MPPSVREQILARADGVPLFTEEFSLASSQVVVPRTLQQLFAARLDVLGKAKLLVQRTSVLGNEAERDLITAVAGIDGPAMEEQLRRLVSAEVLVPVDTPQGAAFSFRHELLQQAAH
jgi:hypothetical protein